MPTCESPENSVAQRLSIARNEIERLRAALTQIVCVADDNANAQHIEMAVPFIREVAANALGRTENKRPETEAERA